MALQQFLSGDPSKQSTLYLAIGIISLVKAIAVRNDPNRFRRELLDAGLFLGVGIVLRRYSTLKEEKRAEIKSGLPDWATTRTASTDSETGLATLANRLTGGPGSEQEPEPTLRDRARGVVS
ncbi:hypothetical protein [Natronobacterium gregoryi]|uniref:Uncharacterized protein n=2 Tax=Natronobacterium gregoryi TaxID=44930 RepID=L0AFV4_NATGS|nr:hypothetical protein [Natronobacterium gregoryi]AFZ72793.1 hypothetical protein Natgr_1588 [Natronobacterium gregoryi SP2]ELY69442.1 hypothetical protein C490_07959 [Natronobacterium gregoryi SP2]PLK21133.1 hypothetical protein CYV19_05745 [Natronobacterium gregoryi SP2]SFJ10616.1 hypothetical protein SAMN05443661_11446 [Natronobacterium gregoryi]